MKILFQHQYKYSGINLTTTVANISDLFNIISEKEFNEALKKIQKISPPELSLNYCPDSKNLPFNIYRKIDDIKKLKGIFSVLTADNQLKAFGLSYKNENELDTCFLASRAFVLPGSFQSQGLLSAYIIPSLQQVQKIEYKKGMITFNTNPYSTRLWLAYKRMIESPSGCKKHVNSICRIYGNKFEYFKLIPKSEIQKINGVAQYVAKCNFIKGFL